MEFMGKMCFGLLRGSARIAFALFISADHTPAQECDKLNSHYPSNNHDWNGKTLPPVGKLRQTKPTA
jgi:hypothetical protein